MAKVIIVNSKQMRACPELRFDAQHYKEDGTCRCPKTKKSGTKSSKRERLTEK